MDELTWSIDGGDIATLDVHGVLTVRSATLLGGVMYKLLMDRGRLLVDLTAVLVRWPAAVRVFPTALARTGGWPLASSRMAACRDAAAASRCCRRGLPRLRAWRGRRPSRGRQRPRHRRPVCPPRRVGSVTPAVDTFHGDDHPTVVSVLRSGLAKTRTSTGRPRRLTAVTAARCSSSRLQGNARTAHRAATAIPCSTARDVMTLSQRFCRARASWGTRPSWAAAVSARLTGALTRL